MTHRSLSLVAAVPALPAEEEGSFLRASAEKLPGHALALSMCKVWEVVREHKDLNLPAHRVRRHDKRKGPPVLRIVLLACVCLCLCALHPVSHLCL